MPKPRSAQLQNYPRISNPESAYKDFLDDEQFIGHTRKITDIELKTLIREAIQYANEKSSRDLLNIPADATPEQVEKAYKRAGLALFKYFRQYSNDPASTADQVDGKHYATVARDLYFGRARQKERMNSGWRYQRLAMRGAQLSGRFQGVSDLGANKSDFIAVIDPVNNAKNDPVNLYISVKNRQNTLGGQDWPNAIKALETMAQNDNKNRRGSYCCIFGITLDRGTRRLKIEQSSGRPFSWNTEVWLADFFWPFFTNFSYEEVMLSVLEVLQDAKAASGYTPLDPAVPALVLESFGAACQKAGLIDDLGFFNDPRRLVHFLCNGDQT